jgi:hypothetical protein
MPTKEIPTARSLQEWMERTGTSSRRLIELVKAQTKRDISPTMMSFILRGSRRCSRMNALALHDVTGVPIATLTQWPQCVDFDKASGRRSKRVA